ncbi:MAG TPA: NAD(P)-dependent alcohol dehydrogenase [Actinomycetota bacterium]|jgi:NADPH:quinone reductase-like Zn-dependent oxidoreductase|nr:NAD(P)-dependent alcohol dehydrogenase [Actinomycetota bacterium]
MRAAVRDRYGPPEVVRVVEVEKPAVKDHDVLVRVHATTVNRTDCGLRAAKPWIYRLFLGLRRPRRTVLGTEFAGEVEAVGDTVTAFEVGDRVFGFSGTTFGAHAEYLALPEDASMLATIPEGLTFEEAAPGSEGSHYALSSIRAAKVRRGQDVLVYGATGAIGSAAVQLLKQLGATVTAVCATDQLDLVKGMGADRVIDYTAEDFTRDGHRYDVVMDAVGKSSFGRCKRLLKPRGVYLSSDLGPLSQNPLLALVTPLGRGRRVRFPVPRSDPGVMRHLKELIESGAFRPVVDRRYPLDGIVEAYRYVESGRKIGNVVITVRPSRP